MKANGKRVVSRLEEIYQCGKKEDGTFTYYEGGLSSYIGTGDWSLEGETLTLQERTRHFTFQVEEDNLVFQKEDSGEFSYLTVEDGEKFTAMTE